MKSLHYLLDWVGVKPRGATAAEIAAFEKDIGFKLLPEVREMFSICNGATIKDGTLALMSLEESMQWYTPLSEWDPTGAFKFVPIIEDYQSNPMTIGCGELMPGYVVQFHHDLGNNWVRYRRLENFFLAAFYMINQPSSLYWRSEHLLDDFSKYRDETLAHADNDDRVGSRSIRFANDRFAQLHSSEPSLIYSDHEGIYQQCLMAYKFGLDVVSDSQMHVIEALLQVPDSYIYQYTIERLSRSSRWEAKVLLNRERENQTAFLNRCCDKLNKAEIPTRIVYQHDMPMLEFGNRKQTMTLDWIYVKRNQPDVFQVLVDKTRELLSRNQK